MTLPFFAWWFGASSGDSPRDAAPRASARNSSASEQSRPEPNVADPDASLLARIRGADVSDAHAAFETLFRAYYDILTKAAYAVLHSSDAARDVVSDVFSKLWFMRDRWIPAVTARAYLIAAVRHRALNIARDERRHEISLHQSITSPPFTLPATLEAGVDEDRLSLVYAAIAAMRGIRREVMILRWQRALRVPEIADALGISTNAVSAHLSQALRILKETLGAR